MSKEKYETRTILIKHSSVVIIGAGFISRKGSVELNFFRPFFVSPIKTLHSTKYFS
jgi:hypothetical protein